MVAFYTTTCAQSGDAVHFLVWSVSTQRTKYISVLGPEPPFGQLAMSIEGPNWQKCTPADNALSLHPDVVTYIRETVCISQLRIACTHAVESRGHFQLP